MECYGCGTVCFFLNIGNDVGFQKEPIRWNIVAELYFHRARELVNDFQIGEVEFTGLNQDW